MARRSRFDTVAGKLLLTGVLPSLLAVSALVTLSATDSWVRLRRDAEGIMIADTRGAAEGVTERARTWSLAAELLAGAQRAGLFGRRAGTLQLMREVLEAHPELLSVWMVYEPDADGNDRKPTDADRIPPAAMDEAGRFVPSFERAAGADRTIVLKQTSGMDAGEWYAGVRADFESTRTARVRITEPHLYEGQEMVSYVFPIIIANQFAGVAGVDRSLERVASLAEELSQRAEGDAFFLSREGRFVAAPKDLDGDGRPILLRGQPASKTPFAGLASRWSAARTGEVIEAVDPILGEVCIYAVAKAPAAEWTVVLRRTRASVLADAKASLWRNIGLGALAMAVIASLLFLAARRITRRLNVGVEAAERVARGDLATRIESVGGQDETATLIESLRKMGENLNGLLTSVKCATITLGSTAVEMAASSRHQQASASTFGSASSQIAAAVTEISATGTDLARTMETVSASAVETASLATAGRSGLQGMESVMRELDRATGSIGEKLAAINERSQRITSVITTIGKVADQTNILSINAAIEAEKAGEYGSGFLVIAREIRRLADQTASATLDIEQMVQQMQSAVSAGVMEMDRFSDQVRRGVHDVVSASSGLGEIIDRVNRSTASFQEVAEGMQAQGAGAEQIREAMGHLTTNATQAMESINQFGQAAGNLQEAVASLREAVSRFDLAE
jgi:methyl-accepting chemotaxis protein